MNIDLGKPEKTSLSHFSLRNFWFLLWFKCWYKNITIVGKENLDKDCPTILAINHQNTAMDPLALCGTIFRQITWLARADLYKNKALIPLLHTCKILPIFRKRDGIKSVSDNDIIFRKVVTVLCAKKLVGLFPEGTHWGYRRLRQTRKAIPRIIALAEEENNFNLDININPVGIYYSDYIDIRSDLFIKIGEPVSIRQYIDTIKNNPPVAENEIREAIETSMRKVMLDIPQMDDESYNTIDSLRHICRNQTLQSFPFNGNKQEREFKADKKTIEIIEQEIDKNHSFLEKIKSKVDSYENILKKNKYTHELVNNNGYDAFQIIWNCMKIVALLPFFLLGCITCSLNLFIMNKGANKLAKDILFKNSLMFVLGAVFKTITHGILIILYLIFMPLPWWTVFIFIPFLFLLWTIFIDYQKLIKTTIKAFRFNIGIINNNDDIKNLQNIRSDILSEYSKLIR